MRTWGVTLAALLVAGAIAVASSAGASKSAHLKIPLPAPNQVKVSVVTVKVTAPKGERIGALKVVATNAAQLGSAQTNTQVVDAISPKSSNQQSATFKVWVFIHRYPSAQAADRTTFAAEESFVDLAFANRGFSLVTQFIDSRSCYQLAHEKGPIFEKGKPPLSYNFLLDQFGRLAIVGNLVISNDTPAEEQLDNAVYSKPCPGAENPSDDPPPF